MTIPIGTAAAGAAVPNAARGYHALRLFSGPAWPL